MTFHFNETICAVCTLQTLHLKSRATWNHTEQTAAALVLVQSFKHVALLLSLQSVMSQQVTAEGKHTAGTSLNGLPVGNLLPPLPF